MKVEVTYMSGSYTESFIVRGKTREETEKKIDEEIKKRGWKAEDCWSEKIQSVKYTKYAATKNNYFLVNMYKGGKFIEK